MADFIEMSCHVCSRTNSACLSCYCPTCARNQLYLLRYENARVLLEKDAAGREIEATLPLHITRQGDNMVQHILQETNPGQTPRWLTQAARTQQAQSTQRTNAILAQTEVLKYKIREKKDESNKRAKFMKQRRSDAKSTNYQLDERRDSALSSLQSRVKRTEHLWHSLHNKTAESRVFLCREAASLYGLRQRLKKRRDEMIESYIIGGIPIADLREMNVATPSQISTAFLNIAHLLVLVSHYLSLRLPAEIILPHRNYPAPTIFPPGVSYSSRDILHSRKSTYLALSGSPTALRAADTRRSSRSRPLSIDKTLPRLVKEDPVTYALFLEGASLLAWNVSWLCRTQGLNIKFDSWEDLCNIGRNMWQLLVASSTQNLTVTRAFSGRDHQSKLQSGRDSPKTIIQRTKSFPVVGHYSHGTSHSFLGGANGTEFMRMWKLPTAMKLADKVKSALLGEMANAEWELLEEREWDDGQGHSDVKSKESYTPSGPGTEAENDSLKDNGVFAGPLIHDRGLDDVEDAELESDQRSINRPRGTSGWTKLKSR